LQWALAALYAPATALPYAKMGKGGEDEDETAMETAAASVNSQHILTSSYGTFKAKL